MGRARSTRLLITQAASGDVRRVFDQLVVEEPLTVVLDGEVVTTTMRTPGNDFELAAGCCYTEGLIGGGDIASIRYCSDSASGADYQFNRVEVHTGAAGRGPSPVPPRRTMTTSSCGWCGSDQIDELIERMRPLPASPPIPTRTLVDVVERVREQQRLHDDTGASHAAARFRADGSLVEVREDVGRHNAVDKVVGASLLASSLPAHGDGLFVSGRASVEMIQKACISGFTTVLAVSAPTELAVRAARRAGLHLVGFVRADRLNVYAPERPENVAGASDVAS